MSTSHATDGTGAWVGRPLRRVEDRRFLTGRAQYVDDIGRPHLLHAAFVRSPHAHARITALDVLAAREAPDVVAVLAARDLPDLAPVTLMPFLPSIVAPRRTPLADDTVYMVGAPVALVIARDAYAARDAAERVRVDYKPLTALPTATAALAGAPLGPDLTSNRAISHRWRAGDTEAAFRAAAHVERLSVSQNRVSAMTMEPRAVLAEYDPGTELLSVWVSVQSPFGMRSELARILKFPEERIRVTAPDVGGAFGVKAGVYPEDVLVPLAALRLGRAVKWISTRGEDFQTTTQGRGGACEAEMALAADGTITALRARIVVPIGATVAASAAVPPGRYGNMLPGAYRVASVDIETSGVLTSTAATGAYRGAGRPEAAFVIERLVEQAARALGLDPAELRRRNFIPAAAFPYRTPTGLTYDSGNYAASLAHALDTAGYAALREEQRAARARGELFGVGLATYVEPSAAGWESGAVRVERTGRVTVTTGSCASGQGHETTFAQIVADRIGVRPDAIRVRAGITDGAPQGIGTSGSRSTVLGGSALVRASERVVDKGRQVAAALLEAKVDDVVLDRERGFHVVGVPHRALGWAEVAAAAYARGGLPGGREPGRAAAAILQGPPDGYSFGSCVCAVRIERETGRLEIVKLVLADDCGTHVNPLLVEGQLHGALAQGIGQALVEQIVYDDAGQLLTGSLMDYAVLRADDMPAVTLDGTTTPSPLNPLGAKGVGEAGTIAAPPAIVNAVVDALSPSGVVALDMPLGAERLWRAITRS
jgi:aerobic carbon-monoxide dehydrogenase large subunit